LALKVWGIHPLHHLLVHVAFALFDSILAILPSKNLHWPRASAVGAIEDTGKRQALGGSNVVTEVDLWEASHDLSDICGAAFVVAL